MYLQHCTGSARPRKVQVGPRDLRCRSAFGPDSESGAQQAKEEPLLALALALGTLTVHLGCRPGEAQTAVQVYNNSQEGLCVLCVYL